MLHLKLIQIAILTYPQIIPVVLLVVVAITLILTNINIVVVIVVVIVVMVVSRFVILFYNCGCYWSWILFSADAYPIDN